jgi:hypothetical protein
MKTRREEAPCVYCVVGPGQTRDHVVARAFFPLDDREGIPLVPACRECNGAKAYLEHRLTAVVPFGVRHGRSSEMLSMMVPPRLERNLKLARTLAQGMKYGFVSSDGTTWDTELSVPLEGEGLSALLTMMVRGLAYAEYEVLLPEAECIVRADFLIGAGRALFDQLHAQGGNRTGMKNLGHGIFEYEGVQSKGDPQLSIWRMSLCGIVTSGDPMAPAERVSVVHAFTAPRRMKAATSFCGPKPPDRSLAAQSLDGLMANLVANSGFRGDMWRSQSQ